jgi:hypothetical protein
VLYVSERAMKFYAYYSSLNTGESRNFFDLVLSRDCGDHPESDRSSDNAIG